MTYYLKRFMDYEDQKRYDEEKRRSSWTVNLVSLFSLGNVVVYGMLSRRFLQLKTWKRVATGLGVFLMSHRIGMANSNRETHKINDYFLNKYKDRLKEMDINDIAITHKLNKVWL